jgi:hypothetical protein
MTKLLTDFEQEQGIELPMTFTALIKVFNLNDLTLHYFDEKENFKFRLTKWVRWSKDEEILIDTFIDRSELVNQWNKYLELHNSKEYLPIGYTIKPPHGTLLLNVLSSKFGEIWLHNPNDDTIRYLNKDILAFVHLCEAVKRHDIESVESKMYKRIDEDFWRIDNSK